MPPGRYATECKTIGRLPLPPGNSPGPGTVFLISKYVVGVRRKASNINQRRLLEEDKAGSQRLSWRVSPDTGPALPYSISRPGHVAPVWLQLPQGPHMPATVPSRPLGKRTRKIVSLCTLDLCVPLPEFQANPLIITGVLGSLQGMQIAVPGSPVVPHLAQ